jgi:predicted nucleotidyltransferase
MRLTLTEIELINSMARKYFGPDVHVFLFGSRVDNRMKGGDIDLFISNKNEVLLTLETKVQFLAELKSLIGIQKIDVVFDTASTRSKHSFYQSIIQHNTELKSNL